MFRGRVPLQWIGAASLLLLGPWLAVELYYARPLAAVALGATAREDFLRRYVPFMDDFRALDKVLPREASLYMPYSGMIAPPAVYAPRPPIFTLADWDRQTPLYRMLVQPFGRPFDASLLEPETGLTCSDVVYRNPDAIVVTYRTPNRAPERGTVVVQRCLAETDCALPGKDPSQDRQPKEHPGGLPVLSPRPECRSVLGYTLGQVMEPESNNEFC
jgi:hypothetical protein